MAIEIGWATCELPGAVKGREDPWPSHDFSQASSSSPHSLQYMPTLDHFVFDMIQEPKKSSNILLWSIEYDRKNLTYLDSDLSRKETMIHCGSLQLNNLKWEIFAGLAANFSVVAIRNTI